MPEQVLVVAAHPDDEILGMGGTIARLTAEGNKVDIVFLTDGVGSRSGVGRGAVFDRREAARRACDVVGAQIVGFGEFRDNAIDEAPLLEVIQFLEEVKDRVEPRIVYTHHGGDLSIDHRRACQATLTAWRPQPEERVRSIYAFEVASSTEWSHPSVTPPFRPDTFVDIDRYRGLLLDAYRCYVPEIRKDPHARSLEALQTCIGYRGRQVGLEAAEAFVTLRRIIGGFGGPRGRGSRSASARKSEGKENEHD